MASLQDQLLKLQSDQPSSNSQEEATAFSRVCAVLKRVGLDPEKMTPDTVLEDAGVDSLDRIEITVRLEQESGIELHDADVFSARTVHDLMQLIDQ